jgi:hypothetical protein
MGKKRKRQLKDFNSIRLQLAEDFWAFDDEQLSAEKFKLRGQHLRGLAKLILAEESMKLRSSDVVDLQGQLDDLQTQVNRKRKAISLDDFRKKFPLPDEIDPHGNLMDGFDSGRNPVGGFDPAGNEDDPFAKAKKNAELSKAIPISIVGGKGF